MSVWYESTFIIRIRAEKVNAFSSRRYFEAKKYLSFGGMYEQRNQEQ